MNEYDLVTTNTVPSINSDAWMLHTEIVAGSVQENASEKQKELLKRAYELIQQAEALGKV